MRVTGPIVLKFTDHNSISLKLKLFKGNKGNVYWKLNTSILENQEYCKSIEKFITKYQSKFDNGSFFLKISDMAPIFCEFHKCPLS
jgi:hypothetical protein